MSNISQPPNGQPKKPALKLYKGGVKVQRLNPAEAREFNIKMGIRSSYLLIGNTIKERSR